MPNLGIRSYPDVLKSPPKEYDVQVLDTEAVVLDDGSYYTLILKSGKRVVGLVPWESIFKPAIRIPGILQEEKIHLCISLEQVIEECIPANYRLTAQQQAGLAPFIAATITRWQELNPLEEVDTSKEEALLEEIRDLQKQLKIVEEDK